MSEITSIYLENFQSIGNAVELPIRPLTFLYGPNSAGKSAVYDALLLLNVALKGGDGLADFVRRWTRFDALTGEASAMVVGASFRIRGDFGGDTLSDQVEIPDEFGERLLSIFSVNIDAELRVRLELKPDPTSVTQLNPDPSRLSIWLNKQLILEVHTDRKQYEYGTFVALNADYFGQALKEVIARYGFDPEAPECYEVECLFEWAPIRLRAISLDDNNRRGFNGAIFAIANYVLAALAFWYRAPSLVAADRGTIADSQLAFLAKTSVDVEWLEQADPSIRALIDKSLQQPTFSRLGQRVDALLLPDQANPLKSLAESRLYAHAQSKASRLSEYGLSPGANKFAAARWIDVISATDGPPESLHVYVNRCLSDHLFLDQGYQLDFDICEVTRPNDVGPPPGFPYVTAVVTGFSLHVLALVVCLLRDRTGKVDTFSDVGTGLSCVLRVLTALHSGFSFSQQPELHLHPAMQSALGDIYVERAGRGHERHLIESHSEYVLLRCLRRIRETGAGRRPQNDPLALDPDQISILYFDPQPKGDTRVRKIRVTKGGEFIDRWPRGFFDERGKELFDE